jgi:hypothetical protein
MEIDVPFDDVETDVDVKLSIGVEIVGDCVQLILEGCPPVLVEDGGTTELVKTVTTTVSGTTKVDIEPPTPNEGFI